MIKIQLTIQFYILLLISIFLFVAASNIQSGWLYIIVSLIVSILLHSIINPIFGISKLKFERYFYGSFNENDLIEIKTVIINNSNKKLNFLKLETDLPLRIIDNRKYGLLKNKEHFIIELNKKSKTFYTSEFITDLRGQYNFSDLIVSSYGAFGIVKYTKTIKKENIITIFPVIKPIKLELLTISGNSKDYNYSKQLRKIQDNLIPYNTREYRIGDSFRLINWKATAKRSQLMVKELESENSMTVQIIIDTLKKNKIGILKDSNLEYILKICAGIFKYLAINKFDVEIIYFNENKIQKITEITSNKDFLSLMALLDANSDRKLIELIDENNYKKIILPFFLKPDEDDIKKLNYFYSKGFKIVPFFIETESFDKKIITSNHISNCRFKNIKITKSYNFEESLLI